MTESSTDPKPAKFAHFVLRSPRWKQSVEWWRTVLLADIRHQNDFLCFLTYDDEHHRLAIVKVPEGDDRRSTAGLEHVAFTYASLDDLLTTYTRLKALGITPHAPVHHGMTLSLYYADPDANQVELQIDVLDPDAAEAFMSSDVFAANPIGVSWDPDQMVAERAAGRSVEELIEYVPA